MSGSHPAFVAGVADPGPASSRPATIEPPHGKARRLVARLGKSGTFATLLLAATLAHAEVQIERGFLPDAAPSSFAIALPGGVNFCFDPVRAGVSYVWTGDFLDLSEMRPGAGKFIKAAKLLGPVRYQEAGLAPLRRGDPNRVPVIEFTGYSLRDDAIEFRYTVDGSPVREEIRVRPGGDGLIRRFHFDGNVDAKWWHVVAGAPAAELKREAGGTFVQEIIFAKDSK